jgi:hypothetical protein
MMKITSDVSAAKEIQIRSLGVKVGTKTVDRNSYVLKIALLLENQALGCEVFNPCKAAVAAFKPK